MILEHVNGKLVSLSEGGYKGFREYCKAKADTVGVTGYIQGIRDRNMQLVFEGTTAQCTQMLNFLKVCRSNAMISIFKVLSKDILDDTYYGDFAILISTSKLFKRGKYSDPQYDKRSEYSYGENLDVVSTPDGSSCQEFDD